MSRALRVPSSGKGSRTLRSSPSAHTATAESRGPKFRQRSPATSVGGISSTGSGVRPRPVGFSGTMTPVNSGQSPTGAPTNIELTPCGPIRQPLPGPPGPLGTRASLQRVRRIKATAEETESTTVAGIVDGVGGFEGASGGVAAVLGGGLNGGITSGHGMRQHFSANIHMIPMGAGLQQQAFKARK
ncbi:unnamed protein product [Protopolystoma xenopodis]|uniref:Uncharacterized protein n=1 Tax=Protopolystoma xenopodis TaxID=117903 RepID=A0A448XSU5_9PLAT|nr:unnamed protein product [Protopolystoma xenopodis]